MKKEQNIKLDMEQSMSNRMYLKLINQYFNTTKCCVNCPNHNGECIELAKQGKCNALTREMNEILSFSCDGFEFTTTRYAIARALEHNQENEENPWIGENVNAVIEDYNRNNEECFILYNLLGSRDIIMEIDDIFINIDK